MSDILKITTPLINKNQPISPKAAAQAVQPFNIQDPTRVIQAHNQSELQKQNNGMLEGGDAPALLLGLLKDPAVAVSYLKNIFLLEEIFKLLPANNKTVTPEIEQLFQALMLPAEDIQPELLRQEQASTVFKGPLFDFLRQVSEGAPPEVQVAVATLLKSLNNQLSKEDVLDAVANSLRFLKNSLAPGTQLSQRLENLMGQFRQEGATANFPALKEETLAVLKDIENNILFSPKLSKVLSIVIYNLSRYNDNIEQLTASANRLRQMLDGPQRQQYQTLLSQFMTDLRDGTFPPRQPGGAVNSQVMDALIALISKQSSKGDLNVAEAAKVDRILHSLLSSPCNFTPLLHFIVPVRQEETRAFAEIWINPDSDEREMPDGVKAGKHFLLVIDVEHVGRFEAELFAHGQTIDFSLLCPPEWMGKYEAMMRHLPKALEGTQYRLGHTWLAPLERPRSLMDVFRSLPYKRVGVDVKI